MVERSSGISVINERHETQSLPQHRSDEYTLVGLFEPGAMRTIIVSAEAATTEFLKRRNAFDILRGSSSGAMIASCLASNNCEEMLRTFLYDVPCDEFIKISRLFRGQNIADINFLVRDLLIRDGGIDWQAVGKSNIPVKISARSAITKEPVTIDNFDSEEIFSNALIAAAWMPRIAGWQAFEHSGHSYWDLMDIGAEQAIDDGATHLVIFRGSNNKIKFSKSVLKSNVEINEIKPSRTIRRLEKRQRVLKDAIRLGALAALEFFQPYEAEIDAVREKFEPLGITI
jgi:predicted patatin/cPLA2 family phospholipase